MLRAVVSKEGSMLHVTPICEVDQRLVSAAIAAVSEWRYEPTLLNNEPVEAIITIAVTFRLNWCGAGRRDRSLWSRLGRTSAQIIEKTGSRNLLEGLESGLLLGLRLGQI
jgi:hypothetical protein